jgi:hypothetical protein
MRERVYDLAVQQAAELAALRSSDQPGGPMCRSMAGLLSPVSTASGPTTQGRQQPISVQSDPSEETPQA